MRRTYTEVTEDAEFAEKNGAEKPKTQAQTPCLGQPDRKNRRSIRVKKCKSSRVEEWKSEGRSEGGVEGALGAEAAEAGEEFVGGGDVAGDLEAEVFGGGEF